MLRLLCIACRSELECETLKGAVGIDGTAGVAKVVSTGKAVGSVKTGTSVLSDAC